MSHRVPRSIGLLSAVLVLGAVGFGLRVGMPFYRQWLAIQQIQTAGGGYDTKPAWPEWLRERIGSRRFAARATCSAYLQIVRAF